MSKAMEVQIPASELQVGDKIANGPGYVTIVDVTANNDRVRVHCDDDFWGAYDFNEPVRIRKRS